MRNILFVDDERDYPVELNGRNVITVRTSAMALELLKGSAFYAEIWLDHDLGGDDTTMPIVDWLAEQAFLGEPYPVDCIVIHTANPVGQKNIERTLRRWDYPTMLASAIGWSQNREG